MALQSFSASAPGSLMLMGEHAVLARKSAIVCAIAKRIHVKLTPNDSQTIKITDATLGSLEINCGTLNSSAVTLVAPFQFVLSALALFKRKVKTGFNLDINAEFSSVVGFGSSAAVTVATIAVMNQWIYGRALPLPKLFKLAKKAVLNVQGVGSGADVAASVFGGVLAYKMFPAKIIPLPKIPDFTAIYCGYKMPTTEVVAIVQLQRTRQPQIYAGIFNAMHTCVRQAMLAIRKGDWHALGAIFSHHHGLQHALGVSDASLDSLVHKVNTQPQILGAKISGSGRGDCIIALGALPANFLPDQYAISVAQQGLVYANY